MNTLYDSRSRVKTARKPFAAGLSRERLPLGPSAADRRWSAECLNDVADPTDAELDARRDDETMPAQEYLAMLAEAAAYFAEVEADRQDALDSMHVLTEDELDRLRELMMA